MKNTPNQSYWKSNIKILIVLLLVWFVVSFGFGILLSDTLDEIKIGGVSGHETDKLVEEAKGFVLLAKGLNEKGGADLVYKSFDSGGEVLNFSSLNVVTVRTY